MGSWRSRHHRHRPARLRRALAGRRGAAAGIALALLGACAAVVEDRVETRLTEAGIPAPMAECMAPIWADRLSVSQIRRIADFAGAVRDDGDQLTPARLVEHVGQWGDLAAARVVASSAAQCAFR